MSHTRLFPQVKLQALYNGAFKQAVNVHNPSITINDAKRSTTLQYSEKEQWWEQIQPNSSQLSKKEYRLIKRILELAILIISTPILLPMMFIIAGLLRIESPRSPVLFVQQRTGKDAHRFKMLKFRTMLENAEELKENYKHLNELQWPDFKITNDPRITKLGKFLRKTSLDELPQVINILRGEMSLVGPRPTSFAADTYELWHTVRLDVKPGLTGLWQTVGRGETEFDERVRLDYEYIQRQCLTLDIMIILHTALAAFQGK